MSDGPICKNFCTGQRKKNLCNFNRQHSLLGDFRTFLTRVNFIITIFVKLRFLFIFSKRCTTHSRREVEEKIRKEGGGERGREEHLKVYIGSGTCESKGGLQAPFAVGIRPQAHSRSHSLPYRCQYRRVLCWILSSSHLAFEPRDS